VHDLFNKAEENRDDDGSFEGLAEDYEKNRDRKDASGHGGWKGSVLGKTPLGPRGSRQFKDLMN